MKLVAVIGFITIVTIVLILRLTTWKQSESEHSVSLRAPQPTATACDTISQLLADAQNGPTPGVISQELEGLVSGCNLVLPR